MQTAHGYQSFLLFIVTVL